MTRIANVVVYAEDPPALARFWAAALNYSGDVVEGSWREGMLAAGFDDAAIAKRAIIVDPSGSGPRMAFRHASGPKVGRNRLHVDLEVTPGRAPTVEELDAERDRLVALGATALRFIEGDWGQWHELYWQMLDPEGNEFCIQ